jgi:hypothetical protein
MNLQESDTINGVQRMKVFNMYRALSSNTRKFMMASAVLLCAIQASPDAFAFADATQLTVIQSSSIQGHLFPCPT